MDSKLRTGKLNILLMIKSVETIYEAHNEYEGPLYEIPTIAHEKCDNLLDDQSFIAKI